MSKARVSMSARVVEYFGTSPVEVAEEILGIVTQVVRARRPPKSPTRAAKKTAKRTTPVTDVQAELKKALDEKGA